MQTVLRRLPAALLIVACAHPVWGQTADAVIEKSITAVGGRAAMQKLRTKSTTGTITLETPVGNVEGSVEILNAAPNKVRTLIKADLSSLGAGPLTLDQRFDGTSGYIMDSLQGNRDITGNQLDTMRNGSFPHPFLTYKEMGISVKLAANEKVGDRDAFVLIFEPPAGSTVRNYIDAQTYLPLRSVVRVEVPQLGREIEQVSDFLDYRDVDGVKIPFEIRASSTVQNYTIKVTKVEYNVPIDETLFVKPAR